MEAMDDTFAIDILSAPILDERPWAAFAACAREEGMVFFPQNKREEASALAICAVCPVVDDCLDHAIATNERFGIWGGTTEKQRKQLSRIGAPVAR